MYSGETCAVTSDIEGYARKKNVVDFPVRHRGDVPPKGTHEKRKRKEDGG